MQPVNRSFYVQDSSIEGVLIETRKRQSVSLMLAKTPYSKVSTSVKRRTGTERGKASIIATGIVMIDYPLLLQRSFMYINCEMCAPYVISLKLWLNNATWRCVLEGEL